MYLLDKNNDKIDVYYLHPKDKDLFYYRLEQMKQIPDNEKILQGVTGVGIEKYEIFKNYEDKFDIETIPMGNVNGKYHSLETDILYSQGRNKEILLDAYYLGYLKDKNIARVWDLNKMKYFLLKQTEYSRILPGKKILGEIIQIPESLYLLSLIEQEKFSLIGDKDISEQLNLFRLEQEQSIDLNTIDRMQFIGISPDCYTRTIKKAENDAHILKLLKK